MEHKPRELKLHVKEMVPANQETQAGTGFQEPSAAPLMLCSCRVVSDSFVTPWTTAHQAPLCPWDFPGKSVGVGCHFLLLQIPPSSDSSSGIFPTQGLNPCLLHWQVDSLPLSHQGSSYCTLRNTKRVRK